MTIDELLPCDVRDAYWFVAGNANQVYSSRAKGYVGLSDPAYLDWFVRGGRPRRIANAFELQQVLLQQCPDLAPDRTFTPAETLDALLRIDAARVKAALGRDDVSPDRLVGNDAVKLVQLSDELVRLNGSQTPGPRVEG